MHDDVNRRSLLFYNKLENTYTFVDNKVTILHTCMSLYIAFSYVFLIYNYVTKKM